MKRVLCLLTLLFYCSILSAADTYTTAAESVSNLRSIGPYSYYYAGTYHRLYVTYSGTRTYGGYWGDTFVNYYDYDSQTWGSPVNLGTNLNNYADPRGTPALIVRDDGKILVIWGLDGSSVKYRLSTNAEDISSWGSLTTLNESYTEYPTLVKISNGDIYLFYAASERNLSYRLWNHTTGIWGSKTPLLQFGDDGAYGDFVYFDYPYYDSATGKIWMACDYLVYNGGTGGYFKNEYCMYLDTSNNNIYDVAGNSPGSALSQTNANSGSYKFRAYAGTDNAYIPRLTLDSSKYPHLTYSVMTDASHCAFKYVKWNGSSWTSPVTMFNTVAYPGGETWQLSPAPLLYINSTTDIYALGTASNKDIELWHYDGETWSKNSTVLASADENSKYLTVLSFVLNRPDSALPNVVACQQTNWNSGLAFPNNKTYALSITQMSIQVTTRGTHGAVTVHNGGIR